MLAIQCRANPGSLSLMRTSTLVDVPAAVLESQAFGPYKLPNYRAAQRSSGLQSLSQGETLQRSTMGAEAGSAPPVPTGREDPSSGTNDEAVDVHTAAARWIERFLIPTINKQVCA